VADRHIDYAREVQHHLQSHDLRVDVDGADDTVGEKIRRAVTSKHPAVLVVLVVGDKDVAAGTVGMRLRGEDKEERGVPLEAATTRLAALCRPPR
jgi:threonyl-tRNA synthetase